MPGTGPGALASTSSFILSVVSRGPTPEEVPDPPPQVWEGTFPQSHTLALACFLRLREPRPSACYPLRTGLSRGCTPPYTHTSLHRLVDTFACLDEMGNTSSLGLVWVYVARATGTRFHLWAYSSTRRVFLSLSQTTQVQILALPMISCVTFGTLISHAVL